MKKKRLKGTDLTEQDLERMNEIIKGPEEKRTYHYEASFKLQDGSAIVVNSEKLDQQLMIVIRTSTNADLIRMA